MNGLSINNRMFTSEGIKLIQDYWNLLIANGYVLENGCILVKDNHTINEKLFVVNFIDGKISHKCKTYIINQELYIYQQIYTHLT